MHYSARHYFAGWQGNAVWCRSGPERRAQHFHRLQDRQNQRLGRCLAGCSGRGQGGPLLRGCARHRRVLLRNKDLVQ